jgi:hypothetical protein
MGINDRSDNAPSVQINDRLLQQQPEVTLLERHLTKVKLLLHCVFMHFFPPPYPIDTTLAGDDTKE